MKQEFITKKQGIVLIIMFIIGSSSLMVMGLDAQRDLWLAIVIAIVVGMIMMLVFARLISILPEKDIFETLEFLFGKTIGRLLLIPITWFAFDLCSIVLRNYGQFILTIGLPETPLVVPIIAIMLGCSIAVKYGIEVLGRWSELFVVPIIGFILLVVLILIKYMNFDNVLPILYNGLGPVIKGSFGILAFPFWETVVFLIAFPAFTKSVSTYKIFTNGLLLGGIVIFISSMTDFLVLGYNAAVRLYYPTYSTVARIDIGQTLQRL